MAQITPPAITTPRVMLFNLKAPIRRAGDAVFTGLGE
jgi:hypothetical protein